MTSLACKRPPREDLAKLRAKCVTLHEIGRLYGVSRSLAKKWCRELSIPASARINQRNRFSTVLDRRITYDNETTVMERAQSILGKRFEERRGSYLLDGRPVAVAALLAAAGLSVPQR